MGICDEAGLPVITTSHIIDWFQLIVMKDSNTMRTRNAPKLPRSITTTPTNNVHNMCKIIVLNLKTFFSIPRQVSLHRLVNIFLQNLQRHRRYIVIQVFENNLKLPILLIIFTIISSSIVMIVLYLKRSIQALKLSAILLSITSHLLLS